MKIKYRTHILLLLEFLSPQGEGPLLVTAHAVAVDGGGARHSIKMMGAVGQCGDPLTAPLCFLLPFTENIKTHGWQVLLGDADVKQKL